MAYSIRYGQTMIKEIVPEHIKGKRVCRAAMWTLSAVIVILIAFSCLSSNIWDGFLPGNPEVTGAALDTFTENLSDGMGFRDAAYVFCKEILDASNAGY